MDMAPALRLGPSAQVCVIIIIIIIIIIMIRVYVPVHWHICLKWLRPTSDPVGGIECGSVAAPAATLTCSHLTN